MRSRRCGGGRRPAHPALATPTAAPNPISLWRPLLRALRIRTGGSGSPSMAPSASCPRGAWLALGTIVGEGDVGVFGEAQHGDFVLVHPLPQIVGIGLGHFAALAVLARWDGWKLSRPLGEDGAVAFLQRLVLARGQRLVVAFRDLMTGAKEQPLHALGPRVIMGVDDEGEFAQQMCPAQGVVAVRVAQIRGPAVVHRHTGVAREDADGPRWPRTRVWGAGTSR